MFTGSLIRSGNNAKTVKGDGEFETAIMYLAPADTVPGVNLCPMAELAGCKAGCLNTAGRGAFGNVQAARAAKTVRYRDDRSQFMADLAADLEAFVRYCRRKGVSPAVRLNGTSDIQWEVSHPVRRMVRKAHPTFNWIEEMTEFASVFAAFPEVKFYDYTKIAKRVRRTLPENYTLVLSYSEASPRYAEMIREAAAETGTNVAIVYRDKATRDAAMNGKDFGRTWRNVIDGDRDDLRFNDPRGVVVGLYAKGAAKGDRSGFVVD